MSGIIFTIVIIGLSMVLAILVHELSHIVMGRMHGWCFYYFTFGPIGVHRRLSGRLSFYWVKDWRLWGGAVAIAEEESKSVARLELVSVLIAGPIGSFLVGLMALTQWYLWQRPIFLWVGLLSICLAIVTFLPYRVGNVYSDGGKVVRLLKGCGSCEVEMALHRIGSKVLSQGDFSGVALEDFKVLIESKDIREQYMGYYYSYRYYADCGLDQEKVATIQAIRHLASQVPLKVRRDFREEIS